VVKGEDITLLCVGPRTLELGLRFSKACDKSVGVVAVRSVKPLDNAVLSSIKTKTVFTLEENGLIGGFGQTVVTYFAEKDMPVKVVRFGAEDKFVGHATVEEQFKSNNITLESLLEKAQAI
jgi:1-deoxy-D-xylulose-5-phosphate synthase